jgi:hypothetical protein
LQEYIEQAEQAFFNRKYNTAATLFFKAICAAADLYLFRKAGLVPSSHTHRFNLAEEKFPHLYEILEKDFPFYQDSYTRKISKEAVEVLRDDAHRIKELAQK